MKSAKLALAGLVLFAGTAFGGVTISAPRVEVTESEWYALQPRNKVQPMIEPRYRGICDESGGAQPNSELCPQIDNGDPYLDWFVTADLTAAPRFGYSIDVENTGDVTVEKIEWEYVFRDKASSITSRHIFRSSVVLKPGQSRRVTEISTKPPTDLISAAALDRNSDVQYEASTLILRVFSAGSWRSTD